MMLRVATTIIPATTSPFPRRTSPQRYLEWRGSLLAFISVEIGVNLWIVLYQPARVRWPCLPNLWQEERLPAHQGVRGETKIS